MKTSHKKTKTSISAPFIDKQGVQSTCHIRQCTPKVNQLAANPNSIYPLPTTKRSQNAEDDKSNHWAKLGSRVFVVFYRDFLFSRAFYGQLVARNSTGFHHSERCLTFGGRRTPVVLLKIVWWSVCEGTFDPTWNCCRYISYFKRFLIHAGPPLGGERQELSHRDSHCLKNKNGLDEVFQKFKWEFFISKFDWTIHNRQMLYFWNQI